LVHHHGSALARLKIVRPKGGVEEIRRTVFHDHQRRRTRL